MENKVEEFKKELDDSELEEVSGGVNQLNYNSQSNTLGYEAQQSEVNQSEAQGYVSPFNEQVNSNNNVQKTSPFQTNNYVDNGGFNVDIN